ncbi:mitochondrial acidic protein mam33-like [Rutidosis leptorrhynchoides]|uniref:mitochondrial acidic protein mam33-like n=1 Tax=Rutidosis leptorrhynchoides TaxID=125765 RepID=UPI003A9A13BD
MWRTAIIRATGAIRSPTRTIISAPFRHYSSGSSNSSPSTVVNSTILRSLKEHYTEVSKMAPPPKVSPPAEFTVVKGALESGGPVLKRTYGDEEISISVMRMVNILPGVDPAEIDADDEINQLFLHADVSKPGQDYVLHFLCGLYPDALGIHSVSLRHKQETSGLLEAPSKYNGPSFEALDDRMRDAFHGYIEERGINDSLFPFLQAWLYVKDHRSLMHWFKSVGTCVKISK